MARTRRTAPNHVEVPRALPLSRRRSLVARHTRLRPVAGVPGRPPPSRRRGGPGLARDRRGPGHRGRADPLLGVRVGGRARAGAIRAGAPGRGGRPPGPGLRDGERARRHRRRAGRGGRGDRRRHRPVRRGGRRAQCPGQRRPPRVRASRPARGAAAGNGRHPRRGHLVRGPSRGARAPLAAHRRRGGTRVLLGDPGGSTCRRPASRSSPATRSTPQRRWRTTTSSRRGSSRWPEAATTGQRLRCAR